MATLTEQPETIEPISRTRPVRFLLSFAFGLLATTAVVAGVIAAFDASYTGRILPGVHVGGTDLSGLDRDQAEGRLVAEFASLEGGELVLTADGHTEALGYGELGRRLDLDGMLDRALLAGRVGSPLERLAADIRNGLGGVVIAPVATLDAGALEAAIGSFAAAVDVPAVNAVVTSEADGFHITPGRTGRALDRSAVARAAASALTAVDAPGRVEIEAPVVDTEPAVSIDGAAAARAAAVRIARDIVLTDGAETWTIPGTNIRGWITFGAGADGSYGPVVAREGLEAALAEIAKQVLREPVNATFLIDKGSTVVGVTEGKDGRSLDVPATLASVEQLIHDRAAGGGRLSQVAISSILVEPELTTAEAVQSAPLMEPISEWTTYFPYGIKNGFGANIWIPAGDLDGLVVMPGQWFDFWKSIGPITRERGYKDGGAIINGKTEPQGALAGGICSCSTTLFNAALRAGLEMGARRNHYYYIDRYPLGLDATVFASSSGSVQTMSWRNDTKSPILIRSYGWRVGTKGYVKFVLWSVPTGRTIEFTDPIIKNIKPPTDTEVPAYDLPVGERERVEYPVEGKDVWVTRFVRDADGTIIHEDTYYSHYARITGIVRVGTAPPPTPSPTSTPGPTP